MEVPFLSVWPPSDPQGPGSTHFRVLSPSSTRRFFDAAVRFHGRFVQGMRAAYAWPMEPGPLAAFFPRLRAVFLNQLLDLGSLRCPVVF